MNLRPLNRRPFEPSGPLQSSRRTCHILYVIFRFVEYKSAQIWIPIWARLFGNFKGKLNIFRSKNSPLKKWLLWTKALKLFPFQLCHNHMVYIIRTVSEHKKRIENEYINNGAKDATLWNVFFTLPGITVLTLNYHSQICTFISVYVSIATHTVGQRKTKEKHIL